MRTILLLIAVSCVAGPALAQDARSLEGVTVTIKMDMPGSSNGVEVKPLGNGVDFRSVAASIKANGIGVHSGESITITKVVVKEHHIEVQLGGGGYGTFSDQLSHSSAPAVPYEAKSRREKDLEAEAKYSPDYWERQRARDELHKEERDRYRDNTMAAVVNAQTQAAANANERAARAQSGSRFNIRYNDGFPSGATSAQGIMNALSRYVEFGDVRPSAPPPQAPAGAPAAHGSLHKGLTVAQVERILGPAAKVSERTEGAIELTVREYTTEDRQRVTTKFVGGVLVDYAVTPR